MGRGALVFKGDAPKKKSKKNKHSKKDHHHVATTTSSTKEQSTDALILPPVIRPQTQVSQEQQSQPLMKEGKGRITTSGTVVTGHDTRFDKELDQGDALIVKNSQETEEMRVVTMRLSANSCAISSAFSENCKLPTPFYIINKPRNKELERLAKQREKQQEQKETEQRAFGTYGTNEELVYREKTEHGSYRIQRVKVDASTITRGDLLEMRTQRKADKYC